MSATCAEAIPRRLVPVLEHNRLDLLSLAALTARGCRLVAEGAARAAGADQCLALGGLYERAGRINDALECYRHAVEGRASDDDDIRADALCRLARWSRRTRQYEAATRDWTRILELPAAPARIVREAVEPWRSITNIASGTSRGHRRSHGAP